MIDTPEPHPTAPVSAVKPANFSRPGKLTCLKVGDEVGYRRICTRLVHEVAADGPTTAAYRRGSVSHTLGLFRVCLLRADAVNDWHPLSRLSEKVLAAPKVPTPKPDANFLWAAVEAELLKLDLPLLGK